MSEGRYLKDRALLYVPFFTAVLAICAVILLLPYETVYVRDRTYLDVFLVTIVVCVFVFLLGTLYNVLIWMHGKGLVGTPERRLLRTTMKGIRFIVKGRVRRALSVLWSDAVHLSKLKSISTFRWAVHFMILGGFVLIFFLDLVVTFSLDVLKYEPMIASDGWAKLWIRDFAFDLAGTMLLAGLVIVALRRFVWKPKMLRTELPDAASILLLLAVVLGGFIQEGMGIAGGIPGHEVSLEYSFLGYLFSLVMPSSAGDYYDQAWLMHGVLSALLIAYIPFSKLFHMIATPVAIEVEVMLSKEASG